ncbi:MAG: 16S rRNA (uracil(1498)-N(3))-methyltransferase [Pirellulaceae bacterium]|nr:16S rRNA (uracil(1498)-N(3))-methyltransferase [Pirellulaceae bacterium]
MTHRFFVNSPIQLTSVQLAGDEARHLAQVLRLSAGDQVVLFDGSGSEFVARIVELRRSGVRLEVLERRAVDRESLVSVTLGVALPKGDRQRWLVEKVVELGAARLVPLRTRRGVAQPVESALERLRRAVVEASKQCGRNRLMEVARPADLADYLADAPATAERWFSHPGGQPPPGTETFASVHLAIGPEGGWADEEVELAGQFGWRQVGLGPRILRVETAAVALTTLLVCR